MTVHFPTTLEEAVALPGLRRAGGTDLEERRRSGRAAGDVVDLSRIPGLSGVDVDRGGARIGALTRLSDLAIHPQLREAYPALAATAAGLATPQIRAVATLGGNLLQATRCWYARAGVSCWKTGGEGCPARDGDHSPGVVFPAGGCVWPHPSSLAMALLLYDARVEVHGGADRTVAELLGDGSDPRRDHLLEPQAVLTAVRLPPPTPGERAAYRRATWRELAEWPTVEAACRLVVEDGVICFVRVAAGAVAPTPRRLTAVEEALLSRPPTPIEEAAAAATEGARPLPLTRYKLEMLPALVADVLEAAMAGEPSGELAFGESGLGWPNG